MKIDESPAVTKGIEFMRFLLLLLFLLCMVSLRGENYFRHGDFEQETPGNMPFNWKAAGRARATWRVTADGATSGRQSLEVNCVSPRAPQIYSILGSQVTLTPGERYRISCDACGDEAEAIVLVLGKSWKRFVLSPLEREWRRYEFEYIPEAEDGYEGNLYPIQILCDGIARNVRIDNLRVEPALPGRVIGGDEFQRSRILPVQRFNGEWRSLTAIPEEWVKLELPADASRHSSGEMPAPEDLRGRIAWGWNEEGWIFLIEVDDDCIIAREGANLWTADSVQLCFDPDASRDGSGAMELNLSPLSEAGPAGAYLTWQARIPYPEEAEIFSRRRPGGYLLGGLIRTANLPDVATFNLVLNDEDGDGRKIAWLEEGIHIAKSCRLNTVLLAVTPGVPKLFAEASPDEKAELYRGCAYLAGTPADAALAITLRDSTGKTVETRFEPLPEAVPGSLVVVPFALSLAKLERGMISAVFAGGGASAFSRELVKADRRAEGEAELLRVSRRAEELWKLVDAVPEERRVCELTAPAAILKYGIPRARADFDAADAATDGRERDFYLDRACMQAQELNEVADRLADRLERAKAGTLPAAEPALQAEPPFRAGYGHFGAVAHRWPELREINCRLTQVEIGPWSTVPGGPEVTTAQTWEEHIRPALENARSNGAQVILLLSPHYMPAWAKNQIEDGVVDWLHPAARKAIEIHIRYVISQIRNHRLEDAIHSFCLSNEAQYSACNFVRPFTREKFLEALQKKFGDVGGLNERAGRNFSSFEAALEAGLEDPVIRYEFHRFKTETFADIHAWMRGIIREVWPEARTSGKFMVGRNHRDEYLDAGIDFELLADSGDYNGNDGFNTNGAGDWKVMAAGHDKQYSLRPVPILNMESHVILDGERRKIPYEHIQQATFQQFLQGAGGIVTWLWEPNDYELFDSVVSGNIFNRPADLLAQADAQNDALRLYREVAAFRDSEPEIRILYSPTSYIQNRAVNPADGETLLHNLVTTSGHKAGFLSERQLARGEFGRCRILLAPDVSNLPRECVAALEKFPGKVYTYGDCFKFDEYQRPLPENISAEPLPGQGEIRQFETAFRAWLGKVAPLPVRCEISEGKVLSSNFFWQCVPDGDGWLVNAVNYDVQPVRVRLAVPEGYRVYDLLRAEACDPGNLEMPVRVTRFLRVEKSGD